MQRIVLLGYGSIGQALLPLLLKHFSHASPSFVVLSSNEEECTLAKNQGLVFRHCTLNPQNHGAILAAHLATGDVLINVSVEVSSLALIAWCQKHSVLYIDTCVEPWAGGYSAANGEIETTTNYALRHAALALHRPGATTAVIAHGANPGLVSHFLKAGLRELAQLRRCAPQSSWAELARALGIQTIHIAERDTQRSPRARAHGEFVNTWSVDGLLAESWQPAELGWGSHEQTLPGQAYHHDYGDRSGIYLKGHSAEVRVKSWTPSSGEQLAYLITHHEALSLAHLLTIPGTSATAPTYRPTVHYAYQPSPATCASLEEWIAGGFSPPRQKRLLRDDLDGGFDQLGVLLVFSGGAYWYGSTLSVQEARHLAPCNNATTLQVASGILGALDWVLRTPRAGVVEAESLDHDEILAVARPYLGTVGGVLTDWQPASPGDLQFSNFLQSPCFEEVLS